MVGLLVSFRNLFTASLKTRQHFICGVDGCVHSARVDHTADWDTREQEVLLVFSVETIISNIMKMSLCCMLNGQLLRLAVFVVVLLRFIHVWMD